ncbi:DUF6906 family protein [Robertmurraya kyonggiensis]|uniref:DUF6906 family protein n=1 Tax=Robertmurraya kyonggiensis TaxID=1037680 RepID=UPI0026ABFF69
MKHGKRPSLNQKIIMKNVGLNPENWLVVKNLPDELWIVHRVSGRQKSIKY